MFQCICFAEEDFARDRHRSAEICKEICSTQYSKTKYRSKVDLIYDIVACYRNGDVARTQRDCKLFKTALLVLWQIQAFSKTVQQVIKTLRNS